MGHSNQLRIPRKKSLKRSLVVVVVTLRCVTPKVPIRFGSVLSIGIPKDLELPRIWSNFQNLAGGLTVCLVTPVFVNQRAGSVDLANYSSGELELEVPPDVRPLSFIALFDYQGI